MRNVATLQLIVIQRLSELIASRKWSHVVLRGKRSLIICEEKSPANNE